MDLGAFLAPLDASAPSGTDLRNDARFHALENRLEAASRPARMQLIAQGSTGVVELDWSELMSDAQSLAQSGRDLRLLVIMARIAVNETGLEGLAGALKLLTATVEQYWDNLHPALREAASKREAALRRVNALRQLENADGGVLGDLEFATLLAPRGLGPISGGDLAAGAVSRAVFAVEAPKGLGERELAELAAKHDARLNRVTAACRATAAERPDEMAMLKASVAAARSELTALEVALAPHVTENDVAVRFDTLSKFLARIAQTLDGATAQATTSPSLSTEAPAMSADPVTASSPTVMAAPAAAVPGQINSRRDVERVLDLVIDFYERTEPSSPIPHLARRMRKMVPMNFMQLMEEIAPSGLKEFRTTAGVFDDKTKSGRE